ncbi:MAG: Fe-S cluster assembly protein HesB, partial [Candidatus Hodarchaeota archaeon]
IDTNIRRILIAEGFANKSMSDKELLLISEKLLPKGKSRDWHNALMDYGALVKTSIKTGIKPKSTQSKFKGSSRQFRGRIVKFLTKYNEANKEVIINQCKIPKDKIDKIISSLVKDGLIKLKKEKNIYYIP